MLKQRIITAVFMVAFVVAAIFFLPLSGFMLLSAAVFAIAAWEWGNLSGLNHSMRIVFAVSVFGLLLAYAYGSGWQTNPNSLYVFVAALIWWLIASCFVFTYPISKGVWKKTVVKLLMGCMTIIPAWLAIVFLLEQNEALIFYLIALVSGADIGAYFAGRAFGKAKLAPKVSPGKSWAGFWGGFAVSLVIAFAAFQFNWFALSLSSLLLISVLTMPASVMGDLLESMLKRERGIKDSSQLLPGHGGILDRIDSLTAAAPVFCLCLLKVS